MNFDAWDVEEESGLERKREKRDREAGTTTRPATAAEIVAYENKHAFPIDAIALRWSAGSLVWVVRRDAVDTYREEAKRRLDVEDPTACTQFDYEQDVESLALELQRIDALPKEDRGLCALCTNRPATGCTLETNEGVVNVCRDCYLSETAVR